MEMEKVSQVAYDTLDIIEALEAAGFSQDQAKAVSLVVRKYHEAAGVVTKVDILDVKRDISDIHKDIDARCDQNRSQMQARFENTDLQIDATRKEISARLDRIDDKFEKISLQMTIKLGLMIVGAIGLVSVIIKMHFNF